MSKYYKRSSVKINVNGKDIKLYIFKPTKNAKEKEKTPGILWIHGGGYPDAGRRLQDAVFQL